MAFAGFNSSKLVKGRLQAALYWNRKKNRERRIASETPAQDEPVDMLFDVAFQAMYNEPGGDGSVGIFMTNPEGPSRGVLEQVVPATFFDDGVIGENYYNSVCIYTPETGDTYAYVTGITSQIEALGLDNANTHARIYQRDVLVDSVLNPVISSNSGTQDITKADFNPLGITLDEYDHYRIRIFDLAPPADMQMLFGVEGIAGASGADEIGITWNGDGEAVDGSLSQLTPSRFVPQPGDSGLGSILFDSEAPDPVISIQMQTSFGDGLFGKGLVAPGTRFDYTSTDVAVRVYGDGELIGESNGVWGYNPHGYTISVDIGGTIADGQTIAVRGWVPTAAVQHYSPVALTQPTITGTVQEGQEVNVENGVWANLFDGVESEIVSWYINDEEAGGNTIDFIQLPVGTPWELPAGSAGNWLSAQVQMTVNLPGETRGGSANCGLAQLITAP